jgi:hypothetical protein
MSSMDVTSNTQHIMRECFVAPRGFKGDARNTYATSARHALTACLFVIFCLALMILIGLPVIVAGMVLLLPLRLILGSRKISSGT